MKGKQIERMCRKHLLPHLRDFDASKGLIYRVPIQEILSGFCFESSASDAHGFYLWAFVQPLYVLHSEIVFTFGKRIGFAWEIHEDNEVETMNRVLSHIKREGLSWLTFMNTPEKFGTNVYKLETVNPENVHVLQAAGYSQALADDNEKALTTLDHLLAKNTGPDRDDRPWAQRLFTEVSGFRNLLSRDPSAARAQLRRWRDQSLEALRLKTPTTASETEQR